MFLANERKKRGLREPGESRVTGASGAQGRHCASCGAMASVLLRRLRWIRWRFWAIAHHSILDLGRGAVPCSNMSESESDSIAESFQCDSGQCRSPSGTVWIRLHLANVDTASHMSCKFVLITNVIKFHLFLTLRLCVTLQIGSSGWRPAGTLAFGSGVQLRLLRLSVPDEMCSPVCVCVPSE